MVTRRPYALHAAMLCAVLLLFAVPGRADTTLELKNEFIEFPDVLDWGIPYEIVVLADYWGEPKV